MGPKFAHERLERPVEKNKERLAQETEQREKSR